MSSERCERNRYHFDFSSFVVGLGIAFLVAMLSYETFGLIPKRREICDLKLGAVLTAQDTIAILVEDRYCRARLK